MYESVLNNSHEWAYQYRPVPEMGSGAQSPINSEIRKIAEDIFQAAKYSFAAAAADMSEPVADNSLESDFRRALEGMSAERQQQIQKRANQLVSAPKTARQEMFGRHGQQDKAKFLDTGGFERAMADFGDLQVDQKLLGLKPSLVEVDAQNAQVTETGILLPSSNLSVNGNDLAGMAARSQELAARSEVWDVERLQDIWGPFYTADQYADQSMTDFAPQAATDMLGFYITRVKCVDETNPEFWGSDEIGLGGVSIDETGDTKKISERYVGGGFDDGDSKGYSPHLKYESFSLREGQYWPKRYTMSLLLAEKDHGGLSKVLSTVWERIRDKVKLAISQAVSGALTAYLGPIISQAIGKAVAWVVDKLVGWIIKAFKDDVFPAANVYVTLPSMGARWTYSNGKWGNPVSPRRRAHFHGHGGHYYVEYYWKMMT